MKRVGASTEPCGRPARKGRSVNFSAGPTIPQEAKHPLRQAFWEGLEEFHVEHPVVNSVVCPTEIEGKEDEQETSSPDHSAIPAPNIPSIIMASMLMRLNTTLPNTNGECFCYSQHNPEGCTDI